MVVGLFCPFHHTSADLVVFHRYRKLNSFPRMDSQRHHFRTGGKGNLVSMQQGSPRKGYPVHLQMLSKSRKTLERSLSKI